MSWTPLRSTAPIESRPESPYRAPPPPRDARAAAPDDDDASPRRLVVAATLFILLWSLLRLRNPLFGGEDFGIDPYLALIAAAVSGVFLVKVVVAWCARWMGDASSPFYDVSGSRGHRGENRRAQGSARIAANILSWKKARMDLRRTMPMKTSRSSTTGTKF